MNNIHDPMPANDPYGNNPAYANNPDYGNNPGHGRRRDGEGRNRAALIIHTIGDIAAGFLGLWILLYLLEANQGNVFVGFVESVASWLAGWAQDIFTMETEGLRVLLNYGLPAVIYLLLGHGIAARMRRL